MPPSMYELTVPALLRGFAVLSTYIDKAAAFASENKIAPEVLIKTCRLFGRDHALRHSLPLNNVSAPRPI